MDEFNELKAYSGAGYINVRTGIQDGHTGYFYERPFDTYHDGPRGPFILYADKECFEYSCLGKD